MAREWQGLCATACPAIYVFVYVCAHSTRPPTKEEPDWQLKNYVRRKCTGKKNCTPVQSLLHVSTMLCQQLCSEKRFPLGYYQLSSNNQTEELREISVFLCCFTSFHVPHFPPRWSNKSQSLESLLYCLQIQSN